MDLARTDEQEALRDSLARLLAKTSSAAQVRGAEPLGFDERVWRGLVDLGVPTMGVPERSGGSGASLRDLAVVAEECGAALSPAPVVEAMVAHRLAAQLGAPAPSDRPVTVALRPAADSRCRLVPGGAVARQVLVLAGDDLVAFVPAEAPDLVRTLGSGPLADLDLGRGRSTVLATGDTAAGAHERARAEWQALTACWLVGLGRAALDLGVAYVKERHQFGVPIGSFQAVQHRLADVATAMHGAGLLAGKAAWALDVDEPQGMTLASMAWSFCGAAAQNAASTALHHHGGYGFVEEYDIQLYFRRAKAARLVLADPRRELRHLADRLFGPVEPAAQGPR